MKKAIMWCVALAAVTQLGALSTASSEGARPSIGGHGLSPRTSSSGIRPILPHHRHHHHRRFQQLDFGYGAIYPDSFYGPDLGTEYAEPDEDLSPAVRPPPIPTKCVPEQYSVPSERAGGRAQVTVTKCNVPVLGPGFGPGSPPLGDLK